MCLPISNRLKCRVCRISVVGEVCLAPTIKQFVPITKHHVRVAFAFLRLAEFVQKPHMLQQRNYNVFSKLLTGNTHCRKVFHLLFVRFQICRILKQHMSANVKVVHNLLAMLHVNNTLCLLGCNNLTITTKHANRRKHHLHRTAPVKTVHEHNVRVNIIVQHNDLRYVGTAPGSKDSLPDLQRQLIIILRPAVSVNGHNHPVRRAFHWNIAFFHRKICFGKRMPDGRGNIHAPVGMILLCRHPRHTQGHNGMIPAGHGGHPKTWHLFVASGPHIAAIFSHRPLLKQGIHRCEAFDHNLCGSRNQQIRGLAFYDFHRLPIPCAQHFPLIHPRRQRIAGNHGNGGIHPQAKGKRHVLSQFLPLAVNLSEILRGDYHAGNRLGAVQHRPRDRPVGPGTVRSPGDHDPVGIDITPAVALMDQRNRKSGQIDLLPEKPVLFTGAMFHNPQRDRLHIR